MTWHGTAVAGWAGLCSVPRAVDSPPGRLDLWSALPIPSLFCSPAALPPPPFVLSCHVRSFQEGVSDSMAISVRDIPGVLEAGWQDPATILDPEKRTSVAHTHTHTAT